MSSLVLPEIKDSLSRVPLRKEPVCSTPKFAIVGDISIPPIYSQYPHVLPSVEVPNRLNPLRPSGNSQRTVAWETTEANHQNHRRSQYMKQREHYRHHDAWSKYYYGSMTEKETSAAETRSILKQQIADGFSLSNKHRVERSLETTVAVARDRKEKQEDCDAVANKLKYLKTYRDENKMLMERLWKERTSTKCSVDNTDRTCMRFNPINWSCSLK